MNIEWAFECSYDRGNGKRTARNQNEDKVFVPHGGFVTKPGNVPWKIYDEQRWKAEINQNGFFGGDAIVTMRINGNETKFYFRIGGKNPPSNVAKTFIESLPNAGPNGNLWFAYAIAKSESKDYNGEGSRYNQFLTLPSRWDQSLGKPLWGDDGGTRPGGYGLFQVTSPDSENIPRDQIWNWQENARGGLTIITTKRTDAVNWMNQQKNANNANGVALPSLTVASVTFAEGTTRTMNDAVTMKSYNGSSRPGAGFTDPDGPAPGFIIDPRAAGYYCSWKTSASGWALSRYNGFSPPFNYVKRVCDEVE